MASKRSPMTVADRAKQFMAFDALTGLRAVLAEKERITVSKIDLSDEYKEELDRIMHEIKVRDMVRVVYFDRDEYVEMRGMVSRIDETARILKVVNEKISFEDLYQLEILEIS